MIFFRSSGMPHALRMVWITLHHLGLSACGFDAPLVTAEVTTTDGTVTLTYAIGTDGYYMMVSGDDSVYTVDGQTVAALCQTAEQLK